MKRHWKDVVLTSQAMDMRSGESWGSMLPPDAVGHIGCQSGLSIGNDRLAVAQALRPTDGSDASHRRRTEPCARGAI